MGVAVMEFEGASMLYIIGWPRFGTHMYKKRSFDF